MNRAEVKAQLLAKIEAALDAALDEQEKQGKPNLAQLEDLLPPIRDQFGRDMMQAFIEGQDVHKSLPKSRADGKPPPTRGQVRHWQQVRQAAVIGDGASLRLHGGKLDLESSSARLSQYGTYRGLVSRHAARTRCGSTSIR